MESPFYGYYHVATDCLENKWQTKEVVAFIKKYGGFSRKGKSFHYRHGFCVISLMDVKSYGSWSDSDRNRPETNYINIVTAKKLSDDIKAFFLAFERFLGFYVIDESEEVDTRGWRTRI